MKKITKVLCGILCAGLFLAGCASVSNIKNSSREIVYNGTAATMVDGYLYYGNAFESNVSGFDNTTDYKNSAKLSYLARLNTKINLAAKNEKYSPKSVEQVTKEVVSQDQSFMFVLGDYVYYTAPKTEQEKNDSGKLEYDFDSTKFFRSKLNGDGKKAFYSTTAKISSIEVLKTKGKYYIVLLEDGKLVKFELGKSVKKTIIARDVTSVGMPKTYEKSKVQSTLDWNGSLIYTKSCTDVTGTDVYKVALSGGNPVSIAHVLDKTIEIVGRERDEIFYTQDSTTYKFDASSTSLGTTEYYAGEISGVNLIATKESVKGYIFKANDKLIYKTASNKTGLLKFKYDDNDVSGEIVAIDERMVYIATTSAIYKVDLSDVFERNENGEVTKNITKIVELASIHQGDYAYDGNYVYFYAQLENEEPEEGETAETITDFDANYYLYRAKVTGTTYELLSKTKTAKRHS